MEKMSPIPSNGEIAKAVSGAWQLFMWDEKGMSNFDVSREGFWRSFFAAFLLAPAYLIIILSQRQLEFELNSKDLGRSETASMPDLGLFLLSESLGYVILWVAFPLAMVYIARWFGREDRYFSLIIAMNWSSVIMMGLIFPVDALYLAGFATAETRLALIIPFAIISLAYRWFIIRTAFGTEPGPTSGLVIFSLLIELLIAVQVDRAHSLGVVAS